MSEETSEEQWISISCLADRTGTKDGVIRTLIRKGLMRHARVGRRIKVREVDFNQAMAPVITEAAYTSREWRQRLSAIRQSRLRAIRTVALAHEPDEPHETNEDPDDAVDVCSYISRSLNQ